MKHFLTGYMLATLVAIIGIWLFLLGPYDPCLQQQAGYQAVIAEYDKTQELYELRLAQQDEILLYGLARVATSQEQREEFRRLVALAQAKATKAETIEQLAKRLAPVEAAVKEVASDNHEFIPAAFRSYWGQVMAHGMMRGK